MSDPHLEHLTPLHVGMRNLKTALAATLCAILYYPFDRNPTFACIGAIFGMGNNVGHSWTTGGNRVTPFFAKAAGDVDVEVEEGE